MDFIVFIRTLKKAHRRGRFEVLSLFLLLLAADDGEFNSLTFNCKRPLISIVHQPIGTQDFPPGKSVFVLSFG
jgi:hypothetical protein